LMCGQTCLELTLVSDKDRYSRRFFFAVYLDDLAKLCNRKINVGLFIILYAACELCLKFVNMN